MRIFTALLVAGAALLASANGSAAPRTMSEVLEGSTADDWRTLARTRTLYLELPHGNVVFELAPQFAPRHIDNLQKLVAAHYFRGGAIIRSQDNYVVQWSGPPSAGDDVLPGGAAARLAPEFFRAAAGLEFVSIDSRDAYARDVGFVDGFAAASDGDRAWLAHCYGALGVGRATEADSGNAAELYVVTGHAPRHLDRNVTLIGRVIDGIEHLSALPRGKGALGFYEDESRYVPIRALRFSTTSDPDWQALRTDTDTFQALVASRRHRGEDWFVDPADAIELCNVPLPVRRVE